MPSEAPSEAALPVPRVAIIVAVADNGVIGRGTRIPWHLSSDLKRFKRLTLGHTLILGRKTHQSIGRALPGRRTIVVTRTELDDVETAQSLPEALAAADRPVFLAGGVGIYREGLAFADTLFITRVHAAPEGDVVLPKFNVGDFLLADKVAGERTRRDDHDFTFETYVRVT